MRCHHVRCLAVPIAILVALLTPRQSPAQFVTLASPNQQVNGAFGTAVAIGDLDGDGRSDLVIGAPAETSGTSPAEAGRVYIFPASGGAPVVITSPNEQVGGLFGFAVAVVDDLDGDMIQDLAIGAPAEAPAGSPPSAGRAYLVRGVDGMILSTLVSPNERELGRFGSTVAAAGDLDNDLDPDVVVGAWSEALSGASAAGRAYVFDGISGSIVLEIESPNVQANGFFGLAIVSAGDVDGDERDDLLIGAPGEELVADILEARGLVYLISGADGSELASFDSPLSVIDGRFGASIAWVEADPEGGQPAVLVGAPEEDPGLPPVADAGRAYLFRLSDQSLLRTFDPVHANVDANLGSSVAAVNDVDGDDVVDFLIGARRDLVPGFTVPGPGRAYLFRGDSNRQPSVFRSPTARPGGEFAFAVAAGTDFDSDGRTEIIVGAREEAPPGSPSRAGRVHLLEIMLFADGFESADTTAWSNTIP